jgi:hypothetical protein
MNNCNETILGYIGTQTTTGDTTFQYHQTFEGLKKNFPDKNKN